MSTLTKVLIVLLSVASIFLCGIVATYVANADNFKALYDTASSQLRTAKADVRAANEEGRKLKDNTQQDKATLQAEIGRLKSDLITAKGDLVQVRIKQEQLLSDVDQATSALVAFEKSSEDWHQMYQNEHTELMKVDAELVKMRGQNKQVTAAILEKMAIITQLEGQARQLAKENEDLQANLVKVLRQYGKTVGRAPAVREVSTRIGQIQSPLPGPKIGVVSSQIKELGLKGVITQLDLKNSLAEISIGAADGVKEKMRFYATRGDSFICEILILDVYAERAVGLLERVQSPPKSGDGVSTSIGS